MVANAASPKLFAARLLVLLALVSVVFIPAFSQIDTASITGTVVDPSGAVLPGVEVTVTNVDTGVSVTTTTNGSGYYIAAGLRPGHYRMSLQKTGFKQVVLTDLTANVQDVLSRNFTMRVGAASESITVSGEAAPINTTDASVSTVVERTTVADMPLNGRSFQSLITMTPGVNTVAAFGGTPGQFVVNGQRSDTNYFTVDGVSANVASPAAGNTLQAQGTGGIPTTAAGGGTSSMVSIDALQEFRITTSSFAPEFGRTPGGQISLVTRGGTNGFHGDVFDYFRNTILDANDWFLNAVGKPRPVVQQNDFGGVVGGPIIKDKLFFFVSYEGLRLTNPNPSTVPVPTAAARALAATAVNNTSPVTTGYMAQFLNAYPLPTPGPAASAACTSVVTCVANFTGSFSGKTKLDATSARVDYNMNKRVTLFGRYSHAPSSSIIDNSVTETAQKLGSDTYTAGWITAINSKLSNDTRFNFSYSTLVRAVAPLSYTGSLSTIFPTGYAQPGPSGFTSDNISVLISAFTGGVQNFQIAPAAANHSNGQVNITDTVSYTRGKHGIKFGGDWRQLNPAANQVNFNANYGFSLSAGNGNLCTVGGVSGLPPYVCGNAQLANLQHLFPLIVRFNQYSFFGQDTWRTTPRLTVTYGLRWEINPAMSYQNGVPTFSIVPSSFSIASLNRLTIAPLGTSLYPTRWGNISPRLGIAYQLSNDPKWGRVLRAGVGLFRDTGANVSVISQGPFSGRVNNTTAGSPLFTNFVPFPLSLANATFATAPAPILTAPFFEGSDTLVDPNFNLPRVFQVNLAVEQLLGNRQSFTVSYVGAMGRKLVGDLAYPQPLGNPAQLGNGTVADTVTVFGNYASSGYQSLQAKFQRQFSNGLGGLASYTWAHSIDNASINGAATAVVPTAGQLASGLPLSLARASSDFDIRHTFAASLVYDLPNPSNAVARAILGHWSFDPIFHYQTAVPLDIAAITNAGFGGLSISQRPNLVAGAGAPPIYVFGSDCVAQYVAAGGLGAGCPGGFAFNNAKANTTNGLTTAQITAAGCAAPTTTNTKGPFCTPLPVGTQAVSGNVSRNILRGFPLSELSFSVHREFPIHESIRLRFQADMFNVFNHPQFGPPTGGTTNQANMSVANFGLTNAMTNNFFGSGVANGAGFNPLYNLGGPRNFQFALKLFF